MELNNIRMIVKDDLALLDDLNYWIIGLNGDGTPRSGFTLEDCQARLDGLGTEGTIDDLRALVNDYKPKCEACGRLAEIWYQDADVLERYPKNLTVKKHMITTSWFCEEHKRE